MLMIIGLGFFRISYIGLKSSLRVSTIDMYIDWIAHLYHWQLKPELRHVLRPAAMFDGPTSRSEEYRFVL